MSTPLRIPDQAQKHRPAPRLFLVPKHYVPHPVITRRSGLSKRLIHVIAKRLYAFIQARR